MATSTVHGVRFSDTLAALLDHVEACDGWRIEPGDRTRGPGVIVYAPDKTISPIHVSERGAKFNRPHYENIRRDLYRAGLPPLPADTKPTTTATPATEETPAVPTARKTSPKTSPKTKATREVHNMAEMMNLIGPDADDRAAALAGIVDGLFTRTGDLDVFGDLAAGLIYCMTTWAESATESLVGAAVERATDTLGKEINDALTLASEAEAKAGRLEAALEKSDAALAKAREDCGAALRRAEVAEKEAAELRGALAPLRALLGTADSK